MSKFAKEMAALGGRKASEISPPELVPTDIPLLNIAFSGDVYGGFPPGFTVIAGDSTTYKTLLALNCLKAHQDYYGENSVCLFYNTEKGIPPRYLENQGIDLERMVFIDSCKHIEDLKHNMVKQLEADLDDLHKKGAKVIIIVDSIGSLASKKELDDAIDGKNVGDMTRAKAIRSLFRTIQPYINQQDIPCFMINHVYDEIGTMYPTAVVAGGRAVRYYSQIVFIISKSQEKVGTETVGHKFTLNVNKSRHVLEKSKFPLLVDMHEGINPFSSLLELALKSGHVIAPTQGWYALPAEPEKKMRRSSLDGDFWAQILDDPSFNEWVKKTFQYGSGSKPMQLAEETERDSGEQQ